MKTLFVILLLAMAGCEYNYDDDEPVAPYEIRDIQVNNQQLDHKAIMVFDRLFGFKIQNGAYWVNDAGQWGRGNDPTPAGVINVQALEQMQAEQGQVVSGGGGQQVTGGHDGQQVVGGGAQPRRRAAPSSRGRGGGIPNSRSVNGSVVSGQLDGKNCTFITASGGMTIKTCN